MSEGNNDLPGGRLYIVSTPIGNLKDITLRALEVLGKVDLIAAEDTRRTRVLLQHYDLHTPTTSYYDFNKEKKLPHLLEKLTAGQALALVSDAGTPGISDPAYRFVRECISRQIPLEAVPGATAFVPAVVLSGLPTDRFVFEGFLPQKKGRQTRLEYLRSERRTIVLYESPHRVHRTLRDLFSHLGDREISVARELTKKYEDVTRGRLSTLSSDPDQIKAKGEFVLVIQGQND